MSDLKISQLANATTPLTGSEQVPLVQSGATKKSTVADVNLCKAWVKFRGSDGAVLGGFNVSSVTRISDGVYRVNLTNALTDANFAVIATPDIQGGVTLATMASAAAASTSSADVYVSNYLGTQFNPSAVHVAIFR
jgi:hypothetical protein